VNITAVYISLNSDSFEASTRSQYQFNSNYLTLFISDWLKKLKLNLGSFNRVVFEEGQKNDFSIVGDKAFVICLSEEFEGIHNFWKANDVHDYFVRKYIEGFEKLDTKFDLNLTDQIRSVLEVKFSNCLEYEVKAKSKKIRSFTVQVIHRYKYDIYELLVRVLDGKKEIVKEVVIYSYDPDPFVVNYDVNKIEIDASSVRVINKLRENTIIFKF